MSILHSLDQIALEIFSKTYRIKRDSGLLEWVIRGFTHPPHSYKYLVKEKGTLAQQRRGGGGAWKRGAAASMEDKMSWPSMGNADVLIAPEQSAGSEEPVKATPAVSLLSL